MPAGALAGLCPACLLAQGAETDGGGGARFEPPPLAEVAKLFPQLEILDLLGAGGMGAVYKARQPALDRIVALKILPSQNARGVNFTERFNREARALARLSHPNIVAVHEFGQAGALSYFIMEFVDGANLRLLEQGSRLSPREALQIIPQICDALQYAHDEGVVHRDIKPENVLVDRKGRVKIADFGLAKILGTDTESLRLTAEGQVMGTPHYMAPEQIEKPLSVDHRADIYALGVVLYEMLTGDLPLGKFSPPSRKVQVDVRFDDVVLRALENDPARRYQHASEVKTQVETIADTPARAAAAPGPEENFIRWAGFPVVIERDGVRRVNRKEALKVFAILFGVLTIVFGLVSLVSGRTWFGWLGISGSLSLQLRLLMAALLTAFGVWRALHSKPAVRLLPQTPQGTVILPPERFSRKAVIGACWAPFFFLAALLHFLVAEVTTTPVGAANLPARSTEWWQILLSVTVLPLGLAAPFGTTILGWIAVGDIRRARGRISGLPLAVFDGLFFPLVALDVLLIWAWMAIVNGLNGQAVFEPFHAGEVSVLTKLGAASICVMVDLWIIRRVWRAVQLEGGAPVEPWWSTWRGALGIGLACAVIILAVAKRREHAGGFSYPPQQIAQRDAQTGLLVANLPGGGSVELIAVGEPDAAPGGWWRPDGSPATNLAMEVRTFSSPVAPGTRERVMTLRLANVPPRDPGLRIEFEHEGVSTLGGKVLVNGKPMAGARVLRAAFPEAIRTTSLQVGLGLEPWQTVGTHHASGQSSSYVRVLDGRNVPVNFLQAAQQDGAAQISVAFGPLGKRWDHRVIAVDTNGVEHTSSDGSFMPIERSGLWSHGFRDLPVKAVREFRLQVRPVHWVEFRDLALSPRSPVPPPNPAQFGPVMERTFSELIDFDTGKTSGYPAAQPGANPLAGLGENVLWLRENGFDAEAGVGELHVVNMEFVALQNADWDTLTAPQAMDRLERGSRFAPRDLKPLKEGQLPATFVFRTREGGIGILQLVAFAGGKPQATVRFKLRESGAAQAAKPDTSDAARLVFGGVQERNVAEFIDLDTGKTAQLPEGDDANFNPFEVTPALLSWMQENGLDAHAGAGKIETLGVSIVDLAAGDWDLLQPDALVSRLRDSGRFQMQLEPGLEGLPATFGFRTREGGAGLLQIVSFEKRRPGATVRIKLLSKPQPR
jgi:hypothetical protein